MLCVSYIEGSDSTHLTEVPSRAVLVVGPTLGGCWRACQDALVVAGSAIVRLVQ